MSEDTKPPSAKQTDEEILTEAKKRYKEGVDADEHNRADALDDLKFAWNFQNCQWDEAALKVRGDRPCLVENRLPQFLSMVVNTQRANRPAIKVQPADGKASPAVAEIYEGMVRHIEQWSRADLSYDSSYESAVAASIGYFRVTTEYADDQGFDQEICIRPIENPFTVVDDPHYQLPDGSDRKWCFVSEMVDRGVFEEEYGVEPKAFEAAPAGDIDEGWWDEKQVRIAEYWRVRTERKTITEELPLLPAATNGATAQLTTPRKREVERKVVEQFLLTAHDVIRKSDWAGIYIPVIPVFGKVTNIEGKKVRKSLIRDAKDAQRINNYFLSAETESVALQPKAPWVGPVGAFQTDNKKWSNSNVANHAYLQYDGEVPPQRVAPPQFPAALRETRMAAIESMKAIMGVYDASLGARSNETSGIAIQSRQQQGDISTYHFLDNMTRAIRYAGLVIIDLLPKVYDTARVVRIISPNGDAAMQAVNQIFTDPQTLVQKRYQLNAGRYDVVVKAGPSFATQREEFTATMTQLLKADPRLGEVAGDLIFRNMDFPGAEEIAERLAQKMAQAQGQLPPQVQQAMEQGKQMIGALQQQLQALQQQNAQLQLDGQKKDVEKQLAQLKAAEAQARLQLAESATPKALEYEQELIHTEHLERIKGEAQIWVAREVQKIKSGMGLLETVAEAALAPEPPAAPPASEAPPNTNGATPPGGI